MFLPVTAFSLPYQSSSVLKNDLKSVPSQRRHSPLIIGVSTGRSDELGDSPESQGPLFLASLGWESRKRRHEWLQNEGIQWSKPWPDPSGLQGS